MCSPQTAADQRGYVFSPHERHQMQAGARAATRSLPALQRPQFLYGRTGRIANVGVSAWRCSVKEQPPPSVYLSAAPRNAMPDDR
jgi:hypothetical protein